jgi:hypothetical protein
MNTPWQDIICNAALDSTLKGHENLVFRLKWKDLRSLIVELGCPDMPDDKPDGAAVSARVWCYALRRQVIVNDWIKNVD